MKTISLRLCLTMLLLSAGIGYGWATDVTIASWGKVSFDASTAVAASDGVTGYSSITLTSDKAITSSGTGDAYYGGTAAGATITMDNVPSGYKIKNVTFYGRASKSGSMAVSYSTDNGTTWTSAGSASLSTNEAKKTVAFSSTPSGVNKIKFVHSASTGSLYFGTIVLTGEIVATDPYTVVFNAGTNGSCSTDDLTEESVGAGVTLPSCTPYTGYTFVGWSTSSTPTSANAGMAGATFNPSGNCTLYAYYSANEYSITYKDQNNQDFSGTHGANHPTTHTYATTTNLVSPTKTHYTFGGWFLSSDCSGSAITSLGSTDYTADITLYAKWTEDPKYDAKFFVNGEQQGTTQSLYEGEAITFPGNPSIEGVVFIGWASSPIEGTTSTRPSLVSTSSEKMGAENKTYYAVFAEAEIGNEYTQITSASALEEGGRYLIVGNSSSSYNALPVDKATELTAVTPSSSKINNPDENLIWTLEKSGNSWKIKSVSNDKYLQISGGNLTFETTTSLSFSVSVSSSKFTWTSSASSGSKVLSYYHNGGKFNAYSSANNVYMYKASVTYSDYCTSTTALTPRHIVNIATMANGSATVSIDGQTITSGYKAKENATVTLTANPDTHYHLASWSVTTSSSTINVSENEGVYSFVMPTSDVTVSATFAEDTKYHITANVPDGGSYTVKVGDASAVAINGENDGFDVYANVSILLESTADETHKVQSTPFELTVSEGDAPTLSAAGADNKKSFVMPAKNVTITAQYVQTYTITAGTCDNGTVAADAARASKDTKVTVTVTPAEHYHATEVYYVTDGEVAHNAITATEGVYSFTMPQGNVTIYATFAEDDNVSITWSVNGATDVIAASKVYVGEPIVFPTTVNDVLGNKFMGWVAEGNKDYSHATNAPTYANASEVIASSAATYYAVFATATGSSTDYSYTLNATTAPYIANGYQEGDKTVTATCPTDATKTYNVTYKIANFGNVSSKLQMKKSGDGFMYNITDLGAITSVTLEDGSNLTTRYGTTQNPTSGSTTLGSGDGYFRIVAGSSAGTCTSITVAFTISSVTYSDYCTIVKRTPTLSFSAVEYRTTVSDAAFTAPAPDMSDGLTVTYSAADVTPANCISITEAGALTISAAGKATITATFAGNDTYKPATASYTLFVDEQITISAVLYSTYYNSKIAYVMPSDCEGYVFDYDGGGLTKVYEAESIVPAGEPLVINTTTAGKKTLAFTTSEEATYKSSGLNDLDGTDVETVLEADATAYYYALSLNANRDANSVGFYWMAEGGAAFTNGAHKAYLKLAKSLFESGAPAHFLFEDAVTAVENTEAVEDASAAVKFIENGVLYIQKNGRVYNAMGQLVK